MSDVFKNIDRCRVCGSQNLIEVISMKPQFLSATFVEDNSSTSVPNEKVPLTVVLCKSEIDDTGCGHVQLKEEVNPDCLFKNYFYRSSANEAMRLELESIVTDMMGRQTLNDNDVVVDIGANDGTILEFFPRSAQRIGVEPAQNIDWSHLDRSIHMVNDYYSNKALAPILNGREISALTSIAMFYDFSSPIEIVREIKNSLSPNGLWCNQLSYLPAMLDSLNFYDICHEHLNYYSLTTLEYLLTNNGLKIVDASRHSINGGSLRLFITHFENNLYDTALGKENIRKIKDEENTLGLDKIETFGLYQNRISELSEKINAYLTSENSNNHLVLGLGASTKGNVLLQCFGVTKKVMPYISELNPDKVGLRTLGTDFELISEARARELKPSTMFVLPWYFKDSIVKREAEYLNSGGKLLIPMPYAHLVTKDGETTL